MDVEAQLERLTPEEFDGWVAFRSIEPAEDERLREIVKLGFATLASAWGAKVQPKDLDPWHQDVEAETITDANQAVAYLKQTCGAT